VISPGRRQVDDNRMEESRGICASDRATSRPTFATRPTRSGCEAILEEPYILATDKKIVWLQDLVLCSTALPRTASPC